MPKKCTKVMKFATLGQARRFMLKSKPMKMGKDFTHAYWCGRHKAWHLTSKVKY